MDSNNPRSRDVHLWLISKDRTGLEQIAYLNAFSRTRVEEPPDLDVFPEG